MNHGERVPALVEAGLRRCEEAENAASGMPRRTNEEWAARADRLADLCERRARWWAVLSRWSFGQEDLPSVLVRATVTVGISEDEHARSWREMARDWRRMAENGQCCQVIGSCGCVGDDHLEVA